MSDKKSLHELLQANDKELKRQSIYHLSDDSDLNYEFFIFVDDENTREEIDFLYHLHALLIHEREKLDFKDIDAQALENLQKWLKTEDDCQYRLDWLKIAIEKYPYRLFVVVDKNKWQKNGKNPIQYDFWNGKYEFLKKRICFLDGDEFRNKIENLINEKEKTLESNNLENFKLYLFSKWINHLQYSSNIDDEIVVFVHNMKESSSIYRSLTLPLELQSDEEIIPEKMYEYWLKYDISKSSIVSMKNNNSAKFIFLSRHDPFFSCYTDDGKWLPGDYERLKDRFISLCRFSGVMPTLNNILSMLTELGSYVSIKTFLKLVEEAIIRVGVVDERIQEWFYKLPIDDQGALIQSKIAVAFLDRRDDKGLNKYKQYQNENQNIEARLLENEKNDGLKLELMSIYEDFDMIWPADKREIDILIIHQGILDKFRSQKKQNLTKTLLKWKEKIPFVIVTSGRGRPENIPFGCKFLPFSGIEFIIQGKYLDKYALSTQIFSLREEQR